MALPPSIAADAYNNPIAALAQLLKGSQRVDPFAENRKFAADLIARQTATPIGSEGEGWARLGQTAVGGLAQLGNAYFKRQWDQGSRAEMADIMGEKDETKRIEKLKNAQYIDPEVMAPIFANILAGRTERDQRTNLGTGVTNIFAPGGTQAPPGAVPPGVPPSAVPPGATWPMPPGGGWPVDPDIYGSGTQPPPDPGAVPPPAAPPPPGPTAAAGQPVPLTQTAQAIQQGMLGAGPGTGPQVVEAPTATPVVPQGDNVQTADMRRTAGLESSGNAAAVNPKSGASGLYQFMPGTAADLRAKYPELNLPNDNAASWTEAQQHAAKTRFDQDNARILAQNGMPVTPATLYLAHRAGATGASTLLRQNPNTPMDQVVPAAWIAQNPDMQGKTVGQFAEMAVQRFPGGIQGTADIPGNTAGAPPPDSPAPGQVPPSLLAQQILQGMQRAGPGEGDQVVEGPTATPVVPTQLAQAQAVGPPVNIVPTPRPPAAPPPAPPVIQTRPPSAQPSGGGVDPGADFHAKAQAALAAGQPGLAADLAQKGFEASQKWKAEAATRAATEADTIAREKRAQEEWNRQHGMTSKEKETEATAKLDAANRQRVDDLATSFSKNPDVVKYQVARPVMKAAVEAGRTDSLAADLNLVYAFATMMDPGSVVREGEMGMVNATASAGSQVKGLIAQLQGNSRLDPETKAKLLDQMDTRYSAYRDEHDRVAKYFEGRAKRAGLNVEDIYMQQDRIPYTRGQPITYDGPVGGAPQPAVPAPPAVTTQEVLRPPPGSGPAKPPMVYRDGKLVPQ